MSTPRRPSGLTFHLVVTALTTGALLAVSAPAAAAPFRSGPGANCRADSSFECTRVTVPIDRSGGVPGSVPLYVERGRPPRRGQRRGAVFALAGGPGQGATSLTGDFFRDFFPLLSGRDLIVIDQRGTGLSGALKCPELDGSQSSQPLGDRTAACAARLGAARAFYTTRDSVADIEAVRRRVRAERTLYGVSYGTKVAVAYALRYPGRVERLVLDSVVEPEGQDPFARDTFAAMPRVLDEICRGECERITDDLPRDVATLVDRMRDAPLIGPLVDRRGRRRTASITARQLYNNIRFGDLNPDLRVEYPGAVRSAVLGDPAPLLRLEHRFDDLSADGEPPPDLSDVISYSLQAATLCEEAPLPWHRTAAPEERIRQAGERAAAIPDAAFEPFDRATALALDNDSILEQCRRWPTSPSEPALASGPLPDVPVLVVEGEEDLRTPVEVGVRLAARFPRAVVLRVPKTGHSVIGPTAPCADVALRRFFSDAPIGRPCRRARRIVPVRPLLPAALAAVAPAPGTTGRRGRTLAAVGLTLEDLDHEVNLAFGALPAVRGGGLRRGRFYQRGRNLRLERFSLVPGVDVTGRVAALDMSSGELTVRGSAAAQGRLTLRRGLLGGRLDGRRVSMRLGSRFAAAPPRARFARAP